MSLETLAGEISDSAKAEAKKITTAAKKEAKGLLKEAGKQVEAYRSDVISRAERSSQQLSVETVAAARQANQQRILVARREELDATWERVIEAVGSAKFKGRSDLIKSLATGALSSAGDGMVLRPVSKDRKALEQCAKGVNFGKDVDGIGGFVLESEDGSVMMDYRFEGRLRDAWENNLGDVSQILFGQ